VLPIKEANLCFPRGRRAGISRRQEGSNLVALPGGGEMTLVANLSAPEITLRGDFILGPEDIPIYVETFGDRAATHKVMCIQGPLLSTPCFYMRCAALADRTAISWCSTSPGTVSRFHGKSTGYSPLVLTFGLFHTSGSSAWTRFGTISVRIPGYLRHGMSTQSPKAL